MKRILMVDDVATNLICAAEVLKSSYDITMARSGKEALLLLKGMTPDLILLDINMPEMDGYQVMEKLKENPDTSEIPVVFLTAELDQESEVKGLKMGAMDFLRKPFEPEVMKSRIDNILQITDQKKELQSIAQKDSLTDLLNRRYLEGILEQAGEEDRGYFLLLDLDNFKKVNDSFGHMVGDQVLVKFARVMKEEITDSDCVCRLGGDEFAVYLPGEYDQDKIKSIARRLIAGIEFEVNDLISDACDFKLSVSVGIAEKPNDGKSFDELYGAADKALYHVKQNGKRGYYFYSSDKAGAKETEEENSLINLLQLQRLIEEKSRQSGAYRVEYDGFKRIYHFVARCMERKSQDVQLVLFTIQGDRIGTEEAGKKAMELLDQAVSGSLRRGDVATRCGNTQYVAILMNASPENGNMVAGRIQKKFDTLAKGHELKLVYEMQSIKSKDA